MCSDASALAAVSSAISERGQTPGQALDAALAENETLRRRVEAIEAEAERLRSKLRREGITP